MSCGVTKLDVHRLFRAPRPHEMGLLVSNSMLANAKQPNGPHDNSRTVSNSPLQGHDKGMYGMSPL